jgi:ABC-2 type transport system ATP-binding protein
MRAVTAPISALGTVSARILEGGPVADISISDVPLEDIIADLFGRQPSAA